MRIAVVYVHPALDARTYVPLARRFASSYMTHPPGVTDHALHVVVNAGSPANQKTYEKHFKPLHCEFAYHNNVGKDIGAFQLAASTIPCDLMICLGAPVYFRRAGWLDRIVQVYQQNGPALYGAWAFHQPSPHIRTTAFWMPPPLLASYPWQVTSDSRYEFEHGQRSIVQHVARLGLESYMVTWGGCYPPKDWHHVEQEQCLMLDQHCNRIGYK